MTSTGSSDPIRKPTAREYYPWWLDNLADDVTGEGAAMQGVLQGAENVRRLVLDARALYEHQEFEFTGDYGANGFIEEYTCQIQGEPTSVVVTVKRNTDGKAQHLVVNHRPRSSVLLFARVMGKKYADSPLAKYFITTDSLPTYPRPLVPNEPATIGCGVRCRHQPSCGHRPVRPDLLNRLQLTELHGPRSPRTVNCLFC